MNKILFPFYAAKYDLLENKRRHRFTKIMFGLVMITMLPVVWMVAILNIQEKNYNTKITDNLIDFTKRHPSYINTIPAFFAQPGIFGCFDKGGKMTYTSDYSMNVSFCNADIKKNIDGILSYITGKTNRDYTETKKNLLEAYDSGKIKYCFIEENIECKAEEIIKFEHNRLYYIQLSSFMIGLLRMTSILLQAIYFKIVIYIIYGGDK